MKVMNDLPIYGNFVRMAIKFVFAPYQKATDYPKGDYKMHFSKSWAVALLSRDLKLFLKCVLITKRKIAPLQI